MLVEDNDIFRETLELLFGLRDEIEVVGSVATGDEARRALRCELEARRRADGLPHARHERRRGDARGAGGVPGHAGRLPDARR